MRLPAWFRNFLAYFDNDAPRLAAAGSVALIIVGNQPFYPLYVAAIAGRQGWPSLLTWLSTPFFAAVPALCRRAPLAGLLLLVAASIGNTVVTVVALGTASFVELFYIPCLALAPLLFTGRQAAIGYASCILGVGAGLAFAHSRSLPGLAAFSAGEFQSLARLHTFSVACLLVIFVVLALRIRRGERAHIRDQK